MRRCPRCQSQELSETDVDGVAVDLCPECAGIYLDAGELKQLMDAEDAPIPDVVREEIQVLARSVVKADPTAKIVCPGCGGAMREMNFSYQSNILVDTCPTCGGTWLDAGELRRLQAFAESQRAFMNRHGQAFESMAGMAAKTTGRKMDALEARERGRAFPLARRGNAWGIYVLASLVAGAIDWIRD